MYRFATLTAVSTSSQATPDKYSLETQDATCRAVALAKGWRETCEPFVIPGESRTRWVNLSDAEQAIPALRAMLDAATRREYDVLVIYDYNRLRDLLAPVSKALASYGVQIYSVSQPIEPQDPAEYSPYTSDTAVMMEGLSGITNKLQIADLRRKYRDNMPLRVTKTGIPAISIPFGYRKPKGHESDPKAIPERDPLTVAYVVKMKDMLLAGQSIRQIVEYLDCEHVAPPRAGSWYPQTVRNILRNPYYAGIVRWGLSRSHVDPRTGARVTVWPPSTARIITGQGKHIALWDEETYQAILAELARRGYSFRGKKNNQFTGLMRCGVCGSSLWYHSNGKKDARHIWRCGNGKPGHPTLTHSDALEKVGAALVKAIKSQVFDEPLPEPENPITHPAPDQIEALFEKRKRIEAGYENGLYDLRAFSEKVAALDDQLKTLRQEKESQHAQHENRVRWLETLGGLAGMVDYLPTWLAEEQRGTVNKTLSVLLKEIIWKDGEIELHWL